MSERLAQLALDTLRACEAERSVVAGRRHFAQYWTRDSCFAHWGHLALGEYDRVSRALELFYSGVVDGEVPLRYGDRTMFAPLARDVLSGFSIFVEREPEPEARFVDDKGGSSAIDSAPLLVTLTGLASLCGARVPVEYGAMVEVMDRLEEHERFGLLAQQPYADWCDSIKRRGYVTYTNALYYAALKVMALLAPSNRLAERYAGKAREVRALIDERLWSGTHYIDYVDEVGVDVFPLESNMLCVLFGIADERRVRLIFSSLDRREVFLDRIGQRSLPYPARERSLRMRLMGMGHYHDRMRWLWTSGLLLLADRQCASSERADRIISQLDTLLAGSRWIGEVYSDRGRFSNLLYRSEEPFAWSAGMLLAGLIEDERFDEAFSRIREER